MPPISEPTPPADGAAFVLALTEAQPAIRGYCEASLGHSEEAKDAWQRTNVVLWQKAAQWDASTKFLTWALTVARYEVLSVIRDRQRERERFLFDDDVAEAMADVSLEEAETLSVKREALARCTEKLQPRHREVLTAHYVFGWKQAEIASAHEMRLGAIKVLLMRLRQTLAECIQRQLKRETV
ncbi:MAG: polymerase sigma factor SigM [Verrucomicrobiota bacterium]|jgi:RNA polymerase sigma-70 factor (ECF subfamily)